MAAWLVFACGHESARCLCLRPLQVTLCFVSTSCCLVSTLKWYCALRTSVAATKQLQPLRLQKQCRLPVRAGSCWPTTQRLQSLQSVFWQRSRVLGPAPKTYFPVHGVPATRWTGPSLLSPQTAVKTEGRARVPALSSRSSLTNAAIQNFLVIGLIGAASWTSWTDCRLRGTVGNRQWGPEEASFLPHLGAEPRRSRVSGLR